MQSVQLKAPKTAPPARYAEATLLSAMKIPQSLLRTSGCRNTSAAAWAPATRADISKVFLFYVESAAGTVPTSRAQLIQLGPRIKEPLLTAKWEQQLEESAAES
ncbi:MAG: hypothetical protein ACLSAP_02130 [Oscillospiraceae bacterium]